MIQSTGTCCSSNEDVQVWSLGRSFFATRQDKVELTVSNAERSSTTTTNEKNTITATTKQQATKLKI
jgi:hypothetical protein